MRCFPEDRVLTPHAKCSVSATETASLAWRALSFKDVYYVAAKIHGEPWARNAVRMLMDLLAIVPVDAEVLDGAALSNEPDFEDGIVRSCAELNGADFIITRDRSAFAKCKIRAVSASDYLEIAS